MIPDFQSIMLPLLKYASDEKEHHNRDAIEQLANEFNLSEEEKKEFLSSGQQVIFDNRVAWAKTYLKKAGLLELTRRGFFKITEKGLKVLNDPPDKISIKFLKQYPEFTDFKNLSKPVHSELGDAQEPEEATPEDLIDLGYKKLQKDLSSELLDNIKKNSPIFFERLVVELLVKIGYGGSREDAGKAVGKSGDEGIDGIIKEDKLGLDIVYIQAKKWENQVSRPEIQKFAGALQGKRAKKGIFITTSTFSKKAIEYSSVIESKIVLIDGKKLADLMIENYVGVSKIASYELKKIDLDYFMED
jgi:restriction system protein